MPLLIKCACYSILLLMATCQPMPSASSKPEIFTYFQQASLSDTLHIEISTEREGIPAGDSIPNSLFFSAIPKVLLEQIDYIADSTQALVLGREYFALNDSISAYWVEIRQFWFQHHSLFLYNKSRNTFSDRITVAEFYGGDGGQQLIGSWLFDYDGDGQKDILRREIQHSMIPGDEDVMERIEPSASLLLWRNGQFVETPLQDTAATIKRFPIRSLWE